MKKFHKCQAVEQALRTQIIEAIDAEYLDALRNINTDMINKSIPKIFEYLQVNYGQITAEVMVEKEDELKNYAYCHGSSIDTTANKINPYYLIG